MSHTHYADYLKLDDLLAIQQPLTDHPDELHFIIVHQVHELWFKLALHHLERARAAMNADQLLEAARLIDQVSVIFDNLTAAVEHLQSLPPVAFHHFRRFLAPGSGLQSYQFREIEIIAGRRDPQYVELVCRVLARDSHRVQVESRLEQPSLAETLAQLMERRFVPDITMIYAVPADYPELYRLCEALSVLDHRVLRWRFSHIQLVERTIGAAAVGTGGTTPDYLTATLKTRLFPALWEARNDLTRRVDGER
jgi:tryptophan 2,3-dioxygenase